jgi:hypothetical protein
LGTKLAPSWQVELVETLSKGMQDAQHTDLIADKVGVKSQELCSGRRGLEEQNIEKGLMAANQ